MSESVTEQVQAQISADVAKVKEHLTNNRTTEREALELHEATRRSLVDHSAAKSLGRSSGSGLAVVLGAPKVFTI